MFINPKLLSTNTNLRRNDEVNYLASITRQMDKGLLVKWTNVSNNVLFLYCFCAE